MKIKIKYNKFKIILVLPLSFLKTKFILKRISNSKEDIEKYKKILKLVPQLIKELKRFKKKNGHFNLIEIYSPKENNAKITITI